MLVVNVTWRGRNYIGCLTDSNNECQKNRSASEARCVYYNNPTYCYTILGKIFCKQQINCVNELFRIQLEEL